MERDDLHGSLSTVDGIAAWVESLGEVMTLRPQPGDGSPEVAWGDLFFYYAPEGAIPPGQPFATIVTKDYPDEPAAGLGGDVFRVNIDAGRRDQDLSGDHTEHDVVHPHPVYGSLGWVGIVSPAGQSSAEMKTLLTNAHAAARRRWNRRHS